MASSQASLSYDLDVGQPILAAAGFRAGSELDHRHGSCDCKAETSHPVRRSTISSPIANDAVAAGLGAFRTWIALGCSTK